MKFKSLRVLAKLKDIGFQQNTPATLSIISEYYTHVNYWKKLPNQ